VGVNVEKCSNKRNGLVARVSGEKWGYCYNVNRERKRERFFEPCRGAGTALAENLEKPTPLKNHANIITLQENSMKSMT
jgi:hypothetical protein